MPRRFPLALAPALFTLPLLASPPAAQKTDPLPTWNPQQAAHYLDERAREDAGRAKPDAP